MDDSIIGYLVNMAAVPLLALAGRWEFAAFLMIAERLGKAIRTPVRDAMLSHATTELGRGWGFGLHEAMDQAGAMLGPLIVAAVLYFNGNFQTGFAFLLIPALLTVVVLLVARNLYPRPRDLEASLPELQTSGSAASYQPCLHMCIVDFQPLFPRYGKVVDKRESVVYQ